MTRRKRESAAKRAGFVFVSLFFAVVCLFLLAQLTLRNLPDSKSKLVFHELPKDDPKRRRPDIALAKEFLGWEPRVPLAEGLPKTIEYFKRFA